MGKITKEQFDQFVRGYIVAALWSTTGDSGEHLDANYTPMDITATGRMVMEELCREFVDANEDDLLLYYEARKYVRHLGQGTAWDWAGHDLWLTAAGHGAGFWDRGLGDLGDRLATASKAVCSPHLYVTEEDRIGVER